MDVEVGHTIAVIMAMGVTIIAFIL